MHYTYISFDSHFTNIKKHKIFPIYFIFASNVSSLIIVAANRLIKNFD